MTGAEQVVLAVLCAYKGALTVGDLLDRLAAWGFQCGPEGVRQAIRMLCDDGLVTGRTLPLAATEAGRAACPEGVLPESLRVAYVNWRGESSVRRVLPIRTFHGSNEWHTTPQWLILALDADLGKDRTFSMRTMEFIS